ncbi:MAG: Maf family nucleotide pyrophosphatase [Bacteroidales bacterium]|jgi:septum formation protein|nr:septum formation protein Maf [Bacteroidales bacterium]MDI9575563.1 Maf family nucleotide pyrophosphatase [Bacteroidota bacterium]MDY0401129.1 Maf family nucleotide pyrophosphatase [Bacteroidales bacterium]
MSPIQKILDGYRILLCSKSPRREQLLSKMGIDFIKVENNYKEDIDTNLSPDELVINLSKQKSISYTLLKNKDILLTVDTIVWFDNQLIGKPKNRVEAIKILKTLSGQWHKVFTGITIRNNLLMTSFYDVTEVKFKPLRDEEIEYYVDNYEPYDKAGGYGAQEWLGYIGIERIEGSFFNVMGLPTARLYDELINFLKKIK